MRRANLDFLWRKVGFGTNHRKINDLVLTVDQEVGGSNPPSCTKHLAHPVPNLFRILFQIPFSPFVPTVSDACIRDTSRSLDGGNDVVAVGGVEIGVLGMLADIDEIGARCRFPSNRGTGQ
jgi:hypothetical protein